MKPEELVATKAAPGVRQMFHEIAPTYDRLNHLLSCNIDRRWRRLAAKFLMHPSVTRALDVCSGTGDLALEFARRSAEIGIKPMLISTDFTPAMTTLAKQKFQSSQARLAAAVSDTLQLPFAADTFDVVSVAFGIRNVADLQGGLKEMTRVCRNGGKVAVLEFSHPATPMLRQLYQLYFFRVLPWVGRVISGTRAYSYLPQSVARFPDTPHFTELLKKTTGGPVMARRLTFGIATLYIATVQK